MQRMAATPSRSASFEEEKRLAALDQPLRSQGTLRFSAPSHLEKRTTAPVQEDLVVDGSSLTLDKPAENVHYRVDLARVPELASLVLAIRGVLAGDLQGLRAHYSVGLEGTSEAWRLTLVPLEERVRQLLKVVRIEGAGDQALSVLTVQPNGDESRMTIRPAAG